MRWGRGRVPHGFWDEKENRLAYLQWLGLKLGMQCPEDWYAIQRQHFIRNYGGGLLGVWYRDSPQAAVRELLPDYPWRPWLFKRTPQGYWTSAENRRAYMKWLTRKLKFRRRDDIYGLSKQDFTENGGAGLLGNHYDWSVVAAVREFRPSMNLHEWKFNSVPQGFWNVAENRERYMDWLGERLRIRTPELWYRISGKDIEQNYGGTLLTRFGGSVYRMVEDFQPHFDWKPWLFESTPSGYWGVLENRQQYLHWLGAQVNFKRPYDWYDLHGSHFYRTGAGQLYTHVYRYSLLSAVQERYPNFNWKAERFGQAIASSGV
ncbi:hypothetical protein [Neorhodopirellula lusitana]|nr:hypothetical protein [Neorhodopirellula lusitana]